MSPRLFRRRNLPRNVMMAVAVAAGLAACAPRMEPVPSYVLFFTAFSTQLDSEALQVIQDAATAARAQGNTPIAVQGYANAVGDPQTNKDLSSSRAQRVADQLVADGVPRARITLQPQPLQGDPGVVSRRVEIVVTPR